LRGLSGFHKGSLTKIIILLLFAICTLFNSLSWHFAQNLYWLKRIKVNIRINQAIIGNIQESLNPEQLNGLRLS